MVLLKYTSTCSSSVSEENKSSMYKTDDSTAQTSEPTVGSCQLKNGIIKIRLSKLIDNKKEIGDNDYEVTLCESDALIGCKTLSVPLSPLAPAVYSAYCENLKIKKKSHTKKSKKKGRKNGIIKSVDKKAEKSNHMEVGAFDEPICSNDYEPLKNNKSETELLTTDTDKIENIAKTEVCEENLPQRTQTEDTDMCPTAHSPLNINNTSSLSKNVNNETSCSNVNIQTSAAGSSNSPKSSTESTSLCSSSVVSSKIIGTKILCSIKLGLLDRIPQKRHSDKHNESTRSSSLKKSEVKEESIFNPVHCNPQESCPNLSAEKNTNIIKTERYTPPVCELSRISGSGFDR